MLIKLSSPKLHTAPLIQACSLQTGDILLKITVNSPCRVTGSL